jgi:hypothetical protein
MMNLRKERWEKGRMKGYLMLMVFIFTSLISVQGQDTVTVIGTGDIMLGTNFPSVRYLPPQNSCSHLFSHVAEFLTSADFSFGNLEGTFADSLAVPRQCKDTNYCFLFRMPGEFVHCLAEAGYDMVSVANNHAGDFGAAGKLRTVEILKQAGLSVAGTLDEPFTVVERNGRRIAFCAFGTSGGTPSLIDLSYAVSVVEKASECSDLVIVSMHGGAEGKDFQHVPKTEEEFLGYDRGDVYLFAHRMIDAGADIIFGHGPHVTRGVELYKDRFIAYSLGNFCTYSRFNLQGPNGIAPAIKVYVDSLGVFLKGEVLSIAQAGPGIPYIDPENKAVWKLRELSSADFPESSLIIGGNGLIRKKEE